MAEFEALLRAFLSPVNDIRRNAVHALEAAQAVGGDGLALGLLQVLRMSSGTDLRVLAAVLLRKVINTEISGVAHWTRISVPSQSAISSQLLLAVKEEPVQLVRRRICDTLAEVALHVMADNKPWGELWLTVHGLVSQATAYPMQEAGLLLCEMLGGYIAGNMAEHLPSFRVLYHQRLSDASAPRSVRAAAARAVGTVLISLNSRSTAADVFVGLIPDLVRGLLDSRAARDSESTMTFVGVLVDVADKQAQLFKPCFGDVTRALCGIALDNSGATDNDVRRLCFEVVLSMAENAPSIARKTMPGGGFLAATLPVALRFMLEHGAEGLLTDAEWDALEGRPDGGDDAVDDFASNVAVGEEAVERLGEAIGAEHLLRGLSPMISEALATPARADGSEWCAHFAGLSALSETSDMLPDDDASTHETLLRQVAPFVSSRHPRVRHAALGTLSSLCLHNDPIFQLHTHAALVPLIVAGLKDATSRRVRAQASILLSNYAGTLRADTDEELLQPYLHGLLGVLFRLISPADLWLTEKAVTALSALAEASGPLVAPFYDIIMPGVNQLLGMPEADASGVGGASHRAAQRRAHLARLVKGRALECLSVVGTAVGAERFGPDAVVAMQGIVGLLGASSRGRSGEPAVSGDDPVLMFLWEAVRRIARVIGSEAFAPFVDAIVPQLLIATRAETRVTKIQFGPKTDLDMVADAATDAHATAPVAAADDDEDDDDDEYTHEDAGHSAVIRVKTVALEEKQSAILALGAVASFVRGPAHSHYAGAVLTALLPCLELAGAPFDDIREAAAWAVGGCLSAAASALDFRAVLFAAQTRDGAGAPAAAEFIRMASATLAALAKAAVADDSIELIKSLVSAVNSTVLDVTRRSSFADGSGGPTEADASQGPEFIPLLSSDVLHGVTQLLVQVRQASINRRAVRAAELVVHSDDIDEEEAEAIKKKDEDEWRLQQFIAEAIGAMLRSHGRAYVPIYSALVQPFIEHMSHPDVLSKDRCLALFVIVDVLEFVGEEDAPDHVAMYHPTLLRCAVETTPITVQAAVYGLGAASLSCRQTTLRSLPTVLAALQGATQGAAAKADPCVTDNAVTALAKIIYHVYDGMGGTQRPDVSPATPDQLRAVAAPPRLDLMRAFLARLPLRHDEDEARISLQLICSWLDAGDADILANGMSPLLGAMAAGLLDRNIVTDGLRARVSATLQGLQARPAVAALLQSAWAALPTEAQTAIAKVMGA